MQTFEEYVEKLYRQVVSEYLILSESDQISDSIHQEMVQIYRIWQKKSTKNDCIWIHSKLEWLDKRFRELFSGDRD